MWMSWVEGLKFVLTAGRACLPRWLGFEAQLLASQPRDFPEHEAQRTRGSESDCEKGQVFSSFCACF